MVKKWYVVHTLTGKEEQVKASIEAKIKTNKLEHLVSKVLVPTERVSEITKQGKKKITKRRYFPGYILVQMELTDAAQYLIKNTTGITGFIGAGKKPIPLKQKEVKSILSKTEEKKEKAVPKVVFEKDETIRIKEGPFTNFNGVVEEIYPEKGKLRVSVSIFGRSTPVELDYWQVERI